MTYPPDVCLESFLVHLCSSLSFPTPGVLIPRLFPQVQVLALQSLAPTRSYWLTRSVFLRALGAIFSVAFSVALVQNKALIGDKVGDFLLSQYIHIYTCLVRCT